MARLEIPTIVVYKGSRSQDRPESPTVVVRGGGMPSLPSARQGLAVSGSGAGAPHQDASESDMIDGNANPNFSTSPAPSNSLHRPAPSCPSSDKSDTESKFRSRANEKKLKLLVRSHAMKESTSPPREPHGNGSSSPHSPQSADGEKKIVCGFSPTGTKLNNNETIFNSNLCLAQSPKQMRSTATSPTCRAPSRNGQSSPSQVLTHSPKTSSANGNKLENNRFKLTNTNNIKCNNCVKNNQSERPGLLQTPVSPSRAGQALQHSPKSTNLAPSSQNNQSKSEQRRPNTLNICNNQCSAQCGNTLSVTNSRHKLRHQNSSQGSYDSASPCLSRDSSTEMCYTDSTGIDLEQFIMETLNRNQKDRTVMLRIEKDLTEFAKDRQKASYKFPNMSSYNRMLVHRVSAYFGMEHNVDQSGMSVIVTRTKNTRIPDTRFRDYIRDDLILSEEPRRSILKRDSSSFEDSFKSPDRLSGDYCRRSKSFEEREEEYERARRRIFKDSSGESSEVWPWSSTESSDVSARRLRPSDHILRQNSRFQKGESFDVRDSFHGAVLRPSVSKSYSFGGYTKGMLSRGDSVTSTHSAGARLMKQDSGASMCSRLSPSRCSSSGYKSQSQRSDATISPSLSPSPVPAAMTCGHTVSSQDLASPDSNGNQTVMWAVSSLSSVPPGSIIINPQTNRPYTNADGSVYRYDPDNPPKFFNIENESNVVPSVTKKHAEPIPEPPKSTNGNSKNDSKKQRSSQSTKIDNAAATSEAQVTNTATSPSLPFTPPPPPLPPSAPSASQNPSIPQQQQPSQQQLQPQSHQQSLVKSSMTAQTYSHTNQTAQSYATYAPTSEYNQGVYPSPMGQPTVMMAPQGQASVQNGGQGDVVFNQNQVYTNYAVSMPQGPIPQSGDVSDLSGYFMGMNVYDQRGGGDNHPTSPHSAYPQPPPPSTVQNVPTVQPNYWQPQPNPIPAPQTMYFVPPPGTAISVGQAPGERQQRLQTNYSFSAQTMTPPSQTNTNYVGSYPVPYSSVPAVTPTPGDYTYQPPVHMVPTYFPPGQPAIQPPPVMYRVPTPPNTPTSTQIPGMPLMYVNSSSYAAAQAIVSGGTFGPPNGTSPAPPPGTYMAPLVPNLVFRQNVPVVPGVRATTPGNASQRSRSPTPAHEIFGGGSGDRSAQSQPRYPLPIYHQGVHIVQGDMRLMHPGVPTNPRLQYAPISSPPVIQGCPRPYRPPSYSSNASGACTPTSFDGRNQKIRKQRSKVASLPPSGARPNFYQAPSIPSLSSNVPKDIREGTVKVTITRRNQLVQF